MRASEPPKKQIEPNVNICILQVRDCRLGFNPRSFFYSMLFAKNLSVAPLRDAFFLAQPEVYKRKHTVKYGIFAA